MPRPRNPDPYVTVSASVPESLFERVEVARGDVPRSVWVREAIEARLAPPLMDVFPDAQRAGRSRGQKADAPPSKQAPPVVLQEPGGRCPPKGWCETHQAWHGGKR